MSLQYTYSTSPKINQAAAKITTKLGLPLSKAIDLYLHAIVNTEGIPFKLTLQNNNYDSHQIIQDRINKVERGNFGKRHHLRNV